MQAVRQALEARQQTASTQNPQSEKPGSPPPPKKQQAPRPAAVKPVLKLKPKGASVAKRASELASGGTGATKRARGEEERPPDDGEADTLAGLMQGYGSDSD